MKSNLYFGDMRTVISGWPENCFHSCVTDCPYELGFMGKDWDRTGISFDVNTWIKVYRILRPGAYLLAFGGSRTYHRIACAIEDAGFEIRDQIMWLNSMGFPKSRDIGKSIDKHLGSGGGDWNGWGNALKPAHEPIVVARKPLESGLTLAENVCKWQTGALNIDACRVGVEKLTYDLKGGENLNKISREDGNDSNDAKGCGAYGVGAKQISIGKKTVVGRFPANVIHDGSDDVLDLLPVTKSGAMKHEVKGYDGHSHTGFLRGRSGPSNQHGDEGSAARFFYCAKASRAERNLGLDGIENKHPTVKPLQLMRYLCKLVTVGGGLIIDPFAGSGSTGICVQDGFKFYGIEEDAENFAIAQKRTAYFETL